MVQTETDRFVFSPSKNDELPEYRPVSRLAIAAFVAALFAPLALIQPLLWVVPLIAIVLSRLAMRNIAAAEARPPGRRLAVAAMLMALLFGSWAVTRSLSQYYFFSQKARQFAEAWLGLVRDGKLYQAHQLTLPYYERVHDDQSLYDAYNVKETKKAKDQTAAAKKEELEHEPPPMMEPLPNRFVEWRNIEPQRTIVLAGNKATFRFLRNTGTSHNTQGSFVFEELFELSHERDGRPASIQFTLVVQRGVVDKRAEWQIADIRPK